MSSQKQEFIYALSNSIKELQQGIDMHCCLVTSIVVEKLDEGSLQTLLYQCPKRSREVRLEKAIKETIDSLEITNNGKVSIVMLTQEAFQDVIAQPEDTDEIFDCANRIKGVEAAALIIILQLIGMVSQ